jgi:hypothetical protein
MPKPITPDMTDFPKQDSIAARIYKQKRVLAIIAESLYPLRRCWRKTYGFDVGVLRAAGRWRRSTC